MRKLFMTKDDMVEADGIQREKAHTHWLSGTVPLNEERISGENIRQAHLSTKDSCSSICVWVTKQKRFTVAKKRPNVRLTDPKRFEGCRSEQLLCRGTVCNHDFAMATG
jgi:hypothetical protein